MSEATTIDRYLDGLAERLLLPPARTRRVLRECEDHLRDAAAALVSAGVSQEEAEASAVERFGTPEEVARGFTGAGASLPSLVGAAVSSLASVAVVGLIALGLSGLLALALSGVFGRDFIAGDASGVTYTAARCAEYLEYEPAAKDCRDASVRHHFGEIVDYRIAAGVLGLIGLAGLYVWKRSGRWAARLPGAFGDTVAASVFAVAALGMLALSGGSNGQMGAGLSTSLVCGVVACVYAFRLTRQLAPAVEAVS